MTPAKATLAAYVFSFVILALFGVHWVLEPDWPASVVSILRGLAGALAVLSVGAVVFAFRESADRGPSATAAVAGLGVGTVLLLAALGLLLPAPEGTSQAIFPRTGLGLIGLLVFLFGQSVAMRLWRPREGR